MLPYCIWNSYGVPGGSLSLSPLNQESPVSTHSADGTASMRAWMWVKAT